MMASLQPGVVRVSRITVDRDRTISFMGDEGRVTKTIQRLRAKAAKLGDRMPVIA